MSKVIEIEDALNRINGDIFQEFCDHFLYYKLNPTSVEPVGSVIGKDKSKKGIPDSYFKTKDGKLVFAAYTTKENIKKRSSFLKKLKQDIKDSFDEGKTGISQKEINTVILCFTARLTPADCKGLESYCEGFNNKCELQLYGIRDLSYSVLEYPYLATYLNVTVDTGQIKFPSDFITHYEKNKFSTPLSNKFFYREKEIKEGLEKLEHVDILTVFGATGTGKSKYAIELCQQFCKANTNFTFLCIGNNGLPIWDDIQTTLIRKKNYIILVDDANRVVSNFRLLLSLINDPNRQKIKLVITVRDYAVSVLIQLLNDFNYSTIEITNFSKDELTTLVKSKEFNIQNPAFIERILDIAKGNARLAIMCARVAKESNNLLSLTDASQIYDEYFKNLFLEVDLLKDNNVLKGLSLIAFFGTINKENQEFCGNIFSHVKLEEDFFWEMCYKLNEFEVVDLYENQVVKIPDQILSTYIFYKVVVEKESLNFRFFLDNYLEFENRLIDTIIPVIRIFSYKKVEEKLKGHILSKWHEIELNNNFDKSLNYLNLFWFYLFPQILVYFKKYIDELVEPSDKTYRYAPIFNEFSGGTEKVIEILSRFQVLELGAFKDALELLLYYGVKIPDRLPSVIHIIKERFNFSRLGYQYEDIIQHVVIEALILRAEKGEYVEIFENVLLEILPHFLKVEYHETSSDGRQITIYTFRLMLNESIKSFRKKCFDYLDRKAESNKGLILNTIYNLPVFEYKHSDDIYEFDKEFIFSIINRHFNNQMFKDCFVFLEVIDKLEILEKNIPDESKDKMHGKVYDLVEVLKPEKNHKKTIINWREEEERYKSDLIQFCKDFTLIDITELFDNINSVLELSRENHLQWQLCNSLEILLISFGKENHSLFLELLAVYFDKYNFRFNFLAIFYSFFTTNFRYYLELFSIIPSSRFDVKICFHQTVNLENVTKADISMLYDDLKQTIRKIENQYSFWDLTFITKYSTLKSEIIVYEETIDILLENCDKGISQICFGTLFVEKCIELRDLKFEKIAKVYFYSNKCDPHFDYNKTILRKLIEKDYTVLIQLLTFCHPERISYHDIEHQHYDFIWDLTNYEQVIQSLFDYFASEKRIIFWERAINGFFPKNMKNFEDKPLQFLSKVIKEKYKDLNYVELVFNIICYTYPTFRDDILKEFLTLNSDFETFTKLELVPGSGVYSGSRIPRIQNHQDSWKKVLELLEAMPKRIEFMKHKEYVEKRIFYCDEEIKQEMKREFMDDRYR